MHAWILIAYAVLSTGSVVYVVMDMLDAELRSKPPKQTG